jgi:hypothetical protein
MSNVNRGFVVAATLSALGFQSIAAAQCAPPVQASLDSVARRVLALRLDKPAQARVFAADGSEYTAAAVHLMHTALRHAETACERGDALEAGRQLEDLGDLLRR